MQAFYYNIFLTGNPLEYVAMDKELLRRGVEASYCENKFGTRIYRLDQAEFPKLPSDSEGPYLGDDNSGRSLNHLPDEEINSLREDKGYGPWQPVS